MEWIEIYNNDYFNVEYKRDEDLIYISYIDDDMKCEEIRFPFPTFNEQCNCDYWEKIYEDLSFIVDYNYDKKRLRISHFINYHFDDDIVIDFIPRCTGCKNLVGNMGCINSNAKYCIHGEFYE